MTPKRALAVASVLVVALALGVAAVLGRLAPPVLLEAPARGAVFENVTVVEPGIAHTPGRRVTVEGGRIASIEPADADVPAQGYLLPGLVDSHVHGADERIAGQPDLFRTLLLAHGVTAVRNTGGGAVQLDERARIRNGEIAGPRIFACGPLVDGEPPVWEFSTTLEDPDGADALVAEHARLGYDCLKVYERLRPDVLYALVDAAHARGLTVVGHVPQRVRFEDARIDDVQHLRGLARVDAREPILDPVENLRVRAADWAALSPERIGLAVRTSLGQGVAQTPTLVLFERASRLGSPDALLADESLRLLPRFYGELSWEPRGTPFYEDLGDEDFALLRTAFENAKRLTGALYRAGVRIHAGTDLGNPYLVPGAALHEELALLVDAGLSPEDAIVAATRRPGELLAGDERLGRVVVGAPADLALFREDPTRDLAALGTLAVVVADGRAYPRDALDRALATARDHYRGWLYETVSMAVGERRRDAALRAARAARDGTDAQASGG